MDVDQAYEIAKAIFQDASDRIEAIRSEEDAKIQLINRLLTECLGWRHSDISAESPNENGFSDYLISDGDRKALVLEAKKIGEIALATQSTKRGCFKISGPVLKDARTGIKQAASYCHPLGVPLAVLTDGLVWIVFLPWVPNASYLDKQAVVFPTPEAVLEAFAEFFELLGKSHVRHNTFKAIFDAIHENRLILDRPLVAPVRESDNHLVQKSPLAFDLETVLSSFFSEITGDADPDMLIDCFVETRESRVADFSLERMTNNVLGNIDSPEKDVGESLRAVVQRTVAGEVGQTVFIVGPSGAGKSTFLDRFFARTLSPETRDRCVVISVNALDASGNEAEALPWVTEEAITLVEKQLYPEGYPRWNDLQALYHLEYKKRAEGIDTILYKRDKNAFKEKFASYVEDQVAKDREGYLKRLLNDIVKNRKKLPVFVIDNTDEFTLDFKVVLFQYFQSLRRFAGHCLLIFPATDRSAWTFSKSDIFNIYSSRSFFLPTPPPREVLRKRVEYIKNKISQTPQVKRSAYLLGRGIKVNIKNLIAFADVVETVFVNQDYASKMVGELSNYNMRKALGLCRRILTSPVLNMEDLVRSYVTGDMAAPSPRHFMNALLKGDYEFFKQGDEPLIFPLYQVDNSVKQSPLLSARILLLLRDMDKVATEDASRYLTGGSISAFLEVLSVPEAAVQRALEALLEAGLIEPYDLSDKAYSDSQRFAITHSGISHLNLALWNPVVFEQMALTTRIPDADTAAQIRGAFFANGSYNARLEKVRELFCHYLAQEDQGLCTVPTRTEYDSQSRLTADLLDKWTSKKVPVDELLSVPDMAAQNAEGVVAWFDHYRGFGFVEIDALRDSAFLHARILEQAGLEDVFDGDEVVCDVSRNQKGLMVSKVHSVTRPSTRPVKGVIIKLFPERGYGFMHIPEIGIDAFFNFHVFSPEQQRTLAEGQELNVEIKTDREGRSQVRRTVVAEDAEPVA